MKEGVFSPFQAVNSLSEHASDLLKKLIELRFESDKKTFHSSERQIILKILVEYYGFHLEGFKKPKSLEVLREVFS